MDGARGSDHPSIKVPQIGAGGHLVFSLKPSAIRTIESVMT